MNQVPDWGRRKHEIGVAFRRCPFLPNEEDPEIYEAFLARMGVTTLHDVRILVSVVQDATMMARREERPAMPLETFRDWLMLKLVE